MRPAGLYNLDCLKALKDYPDDYFDLAIADPPYGAGFTEGGGCKGWFTKYHKSAETPKNVGGGGTDSVNGSTGTRHYSFGIRKCRKSYQSRLEANEETRKKL